MKSNIFIPKKIKVGYQNRSDTYTKKLAYVIYYDEKNKLRKEASWNSWRDNEIEPQDFENEPTSGFVLNKKVGDYDSGWNHRHAYVRIYDPRNFEFEITVENLLYILENTSAIKGKGLEGEFVYGWDGKDLVLIPVDSPDFKELQEYNNIVHNGETIKAKDLIIGATYLTKDNQEMIYMGKFDYYSHGYRWLSGGEYQTSKNWSDVPRGENRYSRIDYDDIKLNYGKYFWFAYKYYDHHNENGERVNEINYTWVFTHLKGLSSGKFIKCIDSKCAQEYSDIYYCMEGRSEYAPIDDTKDTFVDMTYEEFENIIVNDNKYNYPVEILSSEVDGKRTIFYISCCNKNNEDDIRLYVCKPYSRYSYYSSEDRFEYKEISNGRDYWSRKDRIEKIYTPVTLQYAYDVIKPVWLDKYLTNGRFYERKRY